MGAKDAEFTEVGDASKVQNTNPMTGQMWDTMSGNTQNLFASLMGFDPASTFAGAAGQAGQAGQSFMQPYQDQMQGLLNSQISSNIRGAENMFAGSGQSGAQQSAIARGIAQPIAQASTQMAGMGAQLGGNMLGQRLGLDQMAYGGQQGMYGQNLQGMQGYGAPEWWQPSYVQTQQASSGWDNFMGGLGQVANIGAGVAMGGGQMGMGWFNKPEVK